jgi:hypothetical protein
MGNMDIRDVIKRRMARLANPSHLLHIDDANRRRAEWSTANKLAKLADVPPRTLYAFLNGKGKTINSDALGKILDVLDIALVPNDPPPRYGPIAHNAYPGYVLGYVPPPRPYGPFMSSHDAYKVKIMQQKERGIERRARAAERKKEREKKAEGPSSHPPSKDTP